MIGKIRQIVVKCNVNEFKEILKAIEEEFIIEVEPKRKRGRPRKNEK